jgi:hypothetical protein
LLVGFRELPLHDEAGHHSARDQPKRCDVTVTSPKLLVVCVTNHLLAVGNFLCMMRQDTTVTTAMQDIQMPGPMNTEPEVVWMAVMIRGVCGDTKGGGEGERSKGERGK